MTRHDTIIAQETFIARLRRHRERNQISLEQIGKATRVKIDLFEAFERNDLSAWPRGLYARAWIRGYATLVGLDAIDTVDEFCRLFPHGDRRMGKAVQEVAAIVAHPSEYRDDIAPEEDRRRDGARVNPPPPVWYVALARSAYQLLTRVVPPLTTRRAGPDSARRAIP